MNTENPGAGEESAPPGEAQGVLVTPAPDAPPDVSASPPAAEPPEPPAPPPSAPSPAEVEAHPVPRHFTAPALLALDRLDDDETFRIRPFAELDDVASLATDLARLGQLFPIDVRLVAPDRLQIVTGFRRVAALRLLQREKVLARLHTELSDADAMLMALASAIHSRSVDADALRAVQAHLEERGRLTPPARDMLEKALSADDELSPENVEEEVDADELAADVTQRLSQCNQDLSLLADVFDQLDDERREALLTQLKYSVDLVAFLEGKA